MYALQQHVKCSHFPHPHICMVSDFLDFCQPSERKIVGFHEVCVYVSVCVSK